ncbi:LysM peptidoglycan-binding domain-containing protein [Plantactinospora sp. GCM10030261]|uniref:LysM peptidoglycan-binding domain-containing protein n=1 Tax=Plantactinospora sp. GCM10030261 TaxID=3273420 RepID=UPI0036083C78
MVSDVQPPPLRLTRRGRIVLIVGVLILLGAVIAVLAPASQAADPAGTSHTTVVRPGDTLWSVAERQLPDHDTYLVIAEIRRLNGLDGYTIYAGQELVLPAGR